jgi:hypothetical protein
MDPAWIIPPLLLDLHCCLLALARHYILRCLQCITTPERVREITLILRQEREREDEGVYLQA